MNQKLVRIILFLCVIFIILFCAISIILHKSVQISLFKLILPGSELKSFQNTVNILILGIAGNKYEGSNLSDSLTVLHIKHTTDYSFSILSIPRDIWSDTLRDKINSAYAYGEAKIKGGGMKLAKAEVSGIIGQPIQYAMIIDFKKFVDLIDFFGGITINVPNSFSDHEYPIEGRESDECNGDSEFRCRYQTISFSKGINHMTGETALKYVRSRHSKGIEEGDFSREKRQQQVMIALKNTFFAFLKSGNLSKLMQAYSLLNSIVMRDITNQQLAVLGTKFILNPSFSLHNIVLNENFFTTPSFSEKHDYKWVLLPKAESFSLIQKYIKCEFEQKNLCNKLIPIE